MNNIHYFVAIMAGAWVVADWIARYIEKDHDNKDDT